MLLPVHHEYILEELAKAQTAGSIADFVPEDLEIEAHNTLWQQSDPTELTLLKLCPSTPAKQVEHEYTQITSYGDDSGDGFFGEQGLPPETDLETARVKTNIRLMGEQGSTFLLASLEQTQKVDGQRGAVNINRSRLMNNILRKKNRNLYKADTTKTRLGASSTRFRGLEQQIREGTDGTTGTSPYGSHVIDMQGASLTVANITEKAAETVTLFGMINCLFMDPLVRNTFERTLDDKLHLNTPLSLKPYVVGQNLVGVQTQGGVITMHTDNILAPLHYGGRYAAKVRTGAPGLATVAHTLRTTPVGGTSKWLVADAGDYYYVVTQVKNGVEGLGVRYPSSGFISVTDGDEVELRIIPSDPLVDSFKVYRGTSNDSFQATGVGAYFMDEIANSGGGGTVTHYDLNDERPGTSRVFGLRIHSLPQARLRDGVADNYHLAKQEAASYLTAPDDQARNTVSVAELGPRLGRLDLKSVLAHVDRPLFYSACSTQCRNPLQNLVFKNVGL